MVVPKMDNLLNGLRRYWGNDVANLVLSYAEQTYLNIKNERELMNWVESLSPVIWNWMMDDTSFSLRNAVKGIGVILSWKTKDEIADLLQKTYEENLWYCIRGTGEALLSAAPAATAERWTIGYNQFCFEIFKPVLNSSEEIFTQFRKNINLFHQRSKSLDGSDSRSDPYDVLYLIEKEAHRFRDVFTSYAKLRKDQIFLEGVANHELNPTFQEKLPSDYSKEQHSKLVKGESPKIISRFAYHTNVLFYYESTPMIKPAEKRNDSNIEKNDSDQVASERRSYQKFRDEYILHSFSKLVQQVYDIHDEQEALSKASLLLTYARKRWHAYKSALKNGLPPSEVLSKKCFSHDLQQWEEFRYKYLWKNTYYKYTMLLEQDQFSEITDTLPLEERSVWRKKFKSDSLKIEGVTIFEWLESLPTTDCRRLWESTICDLYNHIGGHNEYILTGQLVGFDNYFVCSLQHLFFVVFYIVGQSDCLSPDAFLKLLDNYVFQKQ